MFFDSIQTMLIKQNLQQLMFSTAKTLRVNPSHRPDPIMVQVLSDQCVSNGAVNFPCRFKDPARRASLIRLTVWNLDMVDFVINIEEYQYLGAEGHAIKIGKDWDAEKLKLAAGSDLISNDFVVLYAGGGASKGFKGLRLKAKTVWVYQPYFTVCGGRRGNRTNGMVRCQGYSIGSNAAQGVAATQKGQKSQQKVIKSEVVEAKPPTSTPLTVSQPQPVQIEKKQQAVPKQSPLKSISEPHSYMFSQLDIQKVKKLKISSNDTLEMAEPQERGGHRTKSQSGQKMQQKSQKQRKQEKSAADLRSLTFDKQEIKKLLGK